MREHWIALATKKGTSRRKEKKREKKDIRENQRQEKPRLCAGRKNHCKEERTKGGRV